MHEFPILLNSLAFFAILNYLLGRRVACQKRTITLIIIIIINMILIIIKKIITIALFPCEPGVASVSFTFLRLQVGNKNV